MDYNKIGGFITNERKALNLTQAKLAEKLYVSEKTISKWETGKGIPDTNSLPKLCEIFNVTLNDLLNGERLKNNNYQHKAEEQLLELQKEKELSDKRLLISEIILGSVITIFFISILMLSLYAIYELEIYALPIIMIVVSTIILLVCLYFCLYIEQKAGYYLCKKCNHKHVPTFKQVLLSMHMGRTRFMKCPHCNKKSWQKKIIK